MKSLLNNELEQISGGNKCYPIVTCFYSARASGEISNSRPTGYSSNICPELNSGATINNPGIEDPFKLFKTEGTVDGTGYLAAITIGKDICS